ncbi:MAG TPA: hypothetical protein VFE34_10865 [Dongiaceae bacterium]|jgi:hypothetical protein|nr:hypothetical protein [Dongiaceae bacterium]
MLRALLSLGNEHVLRPFDLKVVRRSRVPCYAGESQPETKRIAFFHPPKCGGTSVGKLLAIAFGGPAGLDPIAAEAAAHNLGLAGAREREAILAYLVQRRDAWFISGHFPYSRRAFQGHEEEFDLITILRNPLSRTLSHYYFNRFREGREHFSIEAELADWLRTDQARAAARTFTTMFVGDIDAARQLAIGGNKHEMGAAAAQAIENLKRFTIVGTLECLSEFERAIQRRYGVRAAAGHLRNNAGYPRFAEQPAEVQDRLRELCQEDMMIYESVTKPQALAAQ